MGALLRVNRLDHQTASMVGRRTLSPVRSASFSPLGPGKPPCDSDPTRPIGRWKEAWESAKNRAAISCRFHDLRHTGCTRMLEAGVPFSVVATIMGWSPSTTVRMARRYGHIGQKALRQAVNALGLSGI